MNHLLIHLIKRIFSFFTLLLFLLFFTGCNQSANNISTFNVKKGALITTHFKSLEEFKSVVQVEYSSDRKSWVRLTHKSNWGKVVSVLEKGVSEKDILKTRDGNLLDKIILTIRTPFFVSNRTHLQSLFVLTRRRHKEMGGGDVAFYDLAERMMYHISEEDLQSIPSEDISEKGYLNTFNHINSQSFMTSIFSEELADFVADIHERKNMPELISGNFSEEQLNDIKNGAVDNYVDIINNEWGQEIGKWLKKKYEINSKTYWTPELLTNYLNDIQAYYSSVFQIGFKPFRASDEMVITFANKINRVLNDKSRVR